VVRKRRRWRVRKEERMSLIRVEMLRSCSSDCLPLSWMGGIGRRGGMGMTGGRQPSSLRDEPFASTCGRMTPVAKSLLLLVTSNVFMTFAWYGHLKNLGSRPLYIAILVSWMIALFEYCFQVPANRIGHTVLSLAQLKILQEVVTLTVFVP